MDTFYFVVKYFKFPFVVVFVSREKELARIVIKKEDVDLIVSIQLSLLYAISIKSEQFLCR